MLKYNQSYLVIQNSIAKEKNVEDKYKQQFKKGALEMVLLSLIYKKETYGYEIITNLNETGGKIFEYTREGTVYSILYRLEKSGLIKSRMAPSPANGGMKKYYSITLSGCEVLNDMKKYWEEYTACVNKFTADITKKEEER